MSVDADVERDYSDPKKVVFWKPTDRPNEWYRIWNNPQASMNETNRVARTDAHIDTYREIQRTIMQKILRTDLGTITGPRKREVQRISAQTKNALLVWTTLTGVNLQSEINVQGLHHEDIIRLGEEIVCVAGIEKEKEEKRISATEGRSQQEEYLQPEQIRGIYEKGIEFIFNHIPPQKEQEGLSVRLLRTLMEFKRRNVRWAELRDEGEKGFAVIALGSEYLEAGIAGMGWLGVIPPTYPSIEKEHVLAVDTRSSIQVLKIKPFPVTPEWAGIGLVHELSHLQDLTKGFEQKNPSREEYLRGEKEAYLREIAAVDIVSQDRLQSEVDTAIQNFNIQSVEDVVALSTNLDSYIPIAQQIDREIGSPVPLSRTEINLRMGFYLFAIAFRLIEKQIAPGLERESAYMDAVAKIMTSKNVIPTI